MEIKAIRLYITIGLLFFLFTDCKKKNDVCPKFGYEFTYLKPGVAYSPIADSIPLGNSIILEAYAPKTFFDEERQIKVSLNEPSIFGPFTILKTTGNNILPFTGAIEDVELFSILGSAKKDTIQFSEGQLKSFRTLHWIESSTDSFKLKIRIQPKIKGIFIVSLGQQSNRDSDCALYKYFLKVINPDQHLYFLADANNGYLDDYSRNYAYCFKVY